MGKKEKLMELHMARRTWLHEQMEENDAAISRLYPPRTEPYTEAERTFFRAFSGEILAQFEGNKRLNLSHLILPDPLPFSTPKLTKGLQWWLFTGIFCGVAAVGILVWMIFG